MRDFGIDKFSNKQGENKEKWQSIGCLGQIL